jgi:hypothetical protein
MSLRLLSLVVSAAAVVIMAGALATSSAVAAAGACRAPVGASVVHRSSTAVVYRRARNPRIASFWTCLLSTGRRTTLPGSEPQRALSSFRSAGRFLAFFAAEDNFHDGTATVGVRIFDLRARKPFAGITLDVPDADAPARLRLHSLILTATGTAAWRESGPFDRIGARDLHGKHRVLASGVSGSISDLVLAHGEIAKWRYDGKVQRRRLDRLGR